MWDPGHSPQFLAPLLVLYYLLDLSDTTSTIAIFFLKISSNINKFGTLKLILKETNLQK